MEETRHATNATEEQRMIEKTTPATRPATFPCQTTEPATKPCESATKPATKPTIRDEREMERERLQNLFKMMRTRYQASVLRIRAARRRMEDGRR